MPAMFTKLYFSKFVLFISFLLISSTSLAQRKTRQDLRTECSAILEKYKLSVPYEHLKPGYVIAVDENIAQLAKNPNSLSSTKLAMVIGYTQNNSETLITIGSIGPRTIEKIQQSEVPLSKVSKTTTLHVKNESQQHFKVIGFAKTKIAPPAPKQQPTKKITNWTFQVGSLIKHKDHFFIVEGHYESTKFQDVHVPELSGTYPVMIEKLHHVSLRQVVLNELAQLKIASNPKEIVIGTKAKEKDLEADEPELIFMGSGKTKKAVFFRPFEPLSEPVSLKQNELLSVGDVIKDHRDQKNKVVVWVKPTHEPSLALLGLVPTLDNLPPNYSSEVGMTIDSVEYVSQNPHAQWDVAHRKFFEQDKIQVIAKTKVFVGLDRTHIKSLIEGYLIKNAKMQREAEVGPPHLGEYLHDFSFFYEDQKPLDANL